MRKIYPFVCLAAVVLSGPLLAATTLAVPQTGLPDPLVLIAYGDMRFTQPSEVAATSPGARRALIARIATENPTAILINGDVPWHGVAEDYAQYRAETLAWRNQHLRVYAALGNHEFSACSVPRCLDRWWQAFPEVQGRRWYSVSIGTRVVAIALDTDTSLEPGSEQRLWLEDQVSSMDSTVRVVLLFMHHPPVADVQTRLMTDHNPRPNETDLVDYLRNAAAHSKAHFVVTAGHIHNYERFDQDGVTYLVSGGGGAAPTEVDRSPLDLYQSSDFPNYHYVRLELSRKTLRCEMIRLNDYAAATPGEWQTRDRFDISLQP